MRAASARHVLQLPLRLHGIQLANPVDLLVDLNAWRILGLDVVCGDGSHRFVPFSTISIDDEELAVASPLVLLEELDFYRKRAHSLRELLASQYNGAPLRDVIVGPDGDVVAIVIERDGVERRISPIRVPERAA